MADILNGSSSERMLSLLLSQFEGKPVIKAILELIGEEFDNLSGIKQRYGQTLLLESNLICAVKS